MSEPVSAIRPFHLWYTAALLAVSLGFTAWGCVDLWKTWQLVQHGVHAHGVVVDYKVNPPDKHGGPTYRPVVRLVDPAGKTWEKYEFEAQKACSPAVGQTVEVIYPVGKPGDFNLTDGDNLWAFGMLAVIGGTVVSLLLYGAIVFIRVALKRPAFGESFAWLDEWFIPLKLFSRMLGG